MLNNLLVFDIETVVDTDVVYPLIGKNFATELEKRVAIENYHLEITDGKNAFPRQLFHKVVCISFLLAEIRIADDGSETYNLKEIRSGGNLDSSEKDLVKGFFLYIEKYKPSLVSFNGRGFDIPVLKYRAMKHGISAKYFYNAGDKWNSYNQRYSKEWHCDLLEILSDYGTSARIKLNEVCSILNLPGKFGEMDGSSVQDCIAAGQLQKVRDYCETDVLNTYLVYLYMRQHFGVLSDSSLMHSMEQIEEFLQNSNQKHFKDFFTAWQDVKNNAGMLG